jgi:hypothetical protein
MVTHIKSRRALHILSMLGIVVAMLLASCDPPPTPTPKVSDVSSPAPSIPMPTASDVSSPIPSTPTSVAQTIPSGTVKIEGQPRFLFGANYPWYNYGTDFGENAWGHNGISVKRNEVETDFDTLAGMGVRVVRWFVFADGRAAPEFAADGSVTGLDGQVYADLDAALEIAQEHNIRLILVLLDFQWLAQQKNEDGVLLGGHADSIEDSAKRQTFFQQALQPLLERYGQNPYILAWEIINEPEWAMDDPNIQTNQPLVRIPPEIMQSFVGEAAAFIHQHARQLVTVGSASRRWWDRWENMGLDLCQVHYYPWMEKDTPLNFPSSGLNTKLPCILGEFPTSVSGTETTFTLDQYYQTILKNGYAGAFPWSLRAEDQYSKLNESNSTVQAWAQDLADSIEIPAPVGWVAPPSIPTETPTPYPTKTPTLQPTHTPTLGALPTFSFASPTMSAPGGDPAMYGFELRDGEWVAQNYEDSQAVTAVSRVSSPVYLGKYALRLDVNLVAKDAHLSKGEAFVDVKTFEPLDHSVGPYDLQNGTITCWMYLPGEAYNVNYAPWIGFQVFAKDKKFRSEYGSWQRVHVTHVDQWLRVQLKPRRYVAPDGYMDKGFDPSVITLIGVKIGVDDYYARPGTSYQGPVYADSCSWK